MLNKGSLVLVRRFLVSCLFILFAGEGVAIGQLVNVTMPQGPNGENPSFITSAVQMPSGDRYMWSSEDPGGEKIFFNVMRDITNDGLPDPGAWTHSQSLPVLDMGSGSTAVGTVLWNAAGGLYKNPQDGIRYKGLMYFVYQPNQDDGSVAGRLCLTFSDDLLQWTEPISAVFSHTGSSHSDCSDGNGEVLVEMVSAFHSAATSIRLVFPDGNIPSYLNAISTGSFEDQTFTFLAGATAGTPHLIVRSGQLTRSGMYVPNLSSELDYHIFINVSATYEPSSGLFLVNRVYPYPVDVEGSTIPCNTGSGCAKGIATFPNRAQGYCMRTGTSFGKALQSRSNSWILEGDVGRADGWSSFSGATCSATPRQDVLVQENLGFDFNSVDFVKNPDGTLWRGLDQGVLKVFLLLSGVSDREAVCNGVSNEEFKLFEIRVTFEDCAAAPNV